MAGLENHTNTLFFKKPVSILSTQTDSLLLYGGVTIHNTTDATGINSGGSFTTYGGFSIQKKLFVGGQTKLTDSTESTDTSSGTLVVSGGVGIAKNTNIGGQLTIHLKESSSNSSSGALVLNGGLGIDNSSSATSLTSGGALTISGGASIEKNMFIGSSLVVTTKDITPSLGDISKEKSYIGGSQQVNEAVSGLSFNSALVRSFNAIVSSQALYSSSEDNKYANYELKGLQKNGSWVINSSYIGDNLGLIFSITNSGQVLYTSPDFGPNFTELKFGFRATTTSIYDVGNDASVIASYTGGTIVMTGDNSPWYELDGSEVYYEGNVGIGTDNPLYRLHVVGGNALLEQYVTAGHLHVTDDLYADSLNTQTANLTTATLGSSFTNQLTASTGTIGNLKVTGILEANLNLEEIKATAATIGTFVVTGESTFEGHLLPSETETFDLGSPTKRWRSAYIASNTIYVGDTPISASTSGTISFGDTVLATSTSANVETSLGGGVVKITNTTQATDTSSGSLVVSGGVSVSKDVYIGGNVTTGSLSISDAVSIRKITAFEPDMPFFEQTRSVFSSPNSYKFNIGETTALTLHDNYLITPGELKSKSVRLPSLNYESLLTTDLNPGIFNIIMSGSNGIIKHEALGAHVFSNFSNDIMRIDGSGNVGIGITNPGYTLDVNGTARSSNLIVSNVSSTGSLVVSGAATVGTSLVVLGGPSGSARIADGNMTANSAILSGNLSVSGSISSSSSALGLANATSMSAESLNVSGNVGIGTVNPVVPFQVNNVAATQFPVIASFLATNSTGGSFQAPRLTLGLNSTNSVTLSYTRNGDLSSSNVFGIGHTLVSDNQINLLRNGNVGIGSANPQSALDVNGTIRSSVLTTINNNAPWDHGRISHDGASLFIDAGGAENGMAFRIENTAVGFPAASYTERMRITNSGNVGIGTTDPVSSRLHVTGNGRFTGNNISTTVLVSNSSAVTNFIEMGCAQNANELSTSASAGDGIIRVASGKNLILQASGSGGSHMLIQGSTGNVGIGVTNPGFPLEVVAGTTNPSGTGSYFSPNGSNFGANQTVWIGWSLSAKFNGGVWSTNGFATTSDERIKKDIVDIQDDEALIKLRQIAPKRYKYIDEIEKGPYQVEGFIAQEIEAILPNAVKTQTETLPSIYKKATVTEGNRIKVTDYVGTLPFVVGTKVILYNQDNEKRAVIVKEVINNEFEIEETIEETEVFVYGHEVNDFKVLQKDAIFTVAVAAVQEVDRQLQAEKEAHIQTKIELTQRLEALESRLTAANL